MTTDADPILVETTQRIFRDLGDPQRLHAARDASWQGKLWSALEDAGLTRAWVPEALQGSGGSLADGFAIARAAGRFAVAVPLCETLLASWLLAQASIPAPPGMLTVAAGMRVNSDGTLSGKARAVPFARAAEQLVLLATRDDQCSVALVSRADCQVEPGANVAGDALDHIVLREVRPLACAPAAVSGEALQCMGATLRALQMSGALEAVLELSVAYANERVAFERPIGKFQVIQHNLARLAGEVAAALAAAGSAADALASGAALDAGLILEVASAKIRVGEAVAIAAGIAHQVHGAIGFSQEHVLNRYTQRLWSWRDDFGTESEWAVRLGALVATRGADALWPLLTSR
jgi:acyl-CoA dehydrogenase